MHPSYRILILVNAHAAAHVTRPLEIAKILNEQGHKIVFAGHGRYLEIAFNSGFSVTEIGGLPVERMLKAIQGKLLIKPLYRVDELRDWVEEELKLFREFSPNLVISDNRITARTSTELAGLPLISLFNAHLSQHRKIPFFSYRRTWLKRALIFAQFLDRLENQIEFLFWELVVSGKMNALRRQYKLNRTYAYRAEEGDLNLITDIPEFNPLEETPNNFLFVGPLTWKAPPTDNNLSASMDKSKKTIYLTLGSQGIGAVLKRIIQTLDLSHVQLVVSTGGATIEADLEHTPGVFIHKYVNVDEVLPHCDLIICHGGNGTIYQGLSYGVPILGLATHEEQYYNLQRVMDLELGLGYRLNSLNDKEKWGDFQKSLLDLLNNSAWREKVVAFSSHFKARCGPESAADEVIKYLTSISRL